MPQTGPNPRSAAPVDALKTSPQKTPPAAAQTKPPPTPTHRSPTPRSRFRWNPWLNVPFGRWNSNRKLRQGKALPGRVNHNRDLLLVLGVLGQREGAAVVFEVGKCHLHLELPHRVQQINQFTQLLCRVRKALDA